MTSFEQGFRDELRKIAKLEEEEKLLRKAGPATGATVGGTIGLIRGLKKGKGRGGLPVNVLAGLGAGATLGWVPDIGISAVEAAKRYKKKRLPELLEEPKKPKLKKTAGPSSGRHYSEIEFLDDKGIVHFPPNDDVPAAKHKVNPVTDASVLGKMRPQKED